MRITIAERRKLDKAFAARAIMTIPQIMEFGLTNSGMSEKHGIPADEVSRLWKEYKKRHPPKKKRANAQSIRERGKRAKRKRTVLDKKQIKSLQSDFDKRGKIGFDLDELRKAKVTLLQLADKYEVTLEYLFEMGAKWINPKTRRLKKGE